MRETVHAEHGGAGRVDVDRKGKEAVFDGVSLLRCVESDPQWTDDWRLDRADRCRRMSQVIQAIIRSLCPARTGYDELAASLGPVVMSHDTGVARPALIQVELTDPEPFGPASTPSHTQRRTSSSPASWAKSRGSKQTFPCFSTLKTSTIRIA